MNVILYIDAQRAAHRALRDEVGADAEVEWLAAVSGLDDRLADSGPPVSAVVIGAGVDFELALTTSERLSSSHPDLGVILLTDRVEAAALRRAIRAGVLDVLDTNRAPGELREAIERSRARYSQLHAHDEASGEGRIVLVFSTKGGCGTSFVASNLAVALTQKVNDGIGLVDLSLTSGDLPMMLQLLPAWSIHDVALQGTRLDHDSLMGYLAEHRSGVRLLPAPNDPALAEQVTPESVAHVLTLMRTLFPITIVDTPSYFSDQLLAAIDVADEIVLTTSLDVPSVKNLNLALQTLSALRVGRERMHIVLNRADSSVGLRPTEVERSLDTEIDVQIPSSRDVPTSINQGVPITQLKRRSSVVTAIDQLADRVAQRAPTNAASDTTRPRRLLGRR